MNNVNTEDFGGNKPQSAPNNVPAGITLTKAECDLALRWLDVTRLYAFVEPEDEALAANLNAGGLSFANDGREPDWDHYAALEREHMGDADKSTGIYHPDNRTANPMESVEPPQVVKHIVSVLSVLVDKVRNVEDCGPYGEGWQSSELEGAIAEADAIIASTQGAHQATVHSEGNGA